MSAQLPRENQHLERIITTKTTPEAEKSSVLEIRRSIDKAYILSTCFDPYAVNSSPVREPDRDGIAIVVNVAGKLVADRLGDQVYKVIDTVESLSENIKLVALRHMFPPVGSIASGRRYGVRFESGIPAPRELPLDDALDISLAHSMALINGTTVSIELARRKDTLEGLAIESRTRCYLREMAMHQYQHGSRIMFRDNETWNGFEWPYGLTASDFDKAARYLLHPAKKLTPNERAAAEFITRADYLGLFRPLSQGQTATEYLVDRWSKVEDYPDE